MGAVRQAVQHPNPYLPLPLTMNGKTMQLPFATTLPIDVVRDIFSSLSGNQAADFDEADFAVLPPHCQINAAFGIALGLDDIAHAVETAWPYPVGTPQLDALVVVRASGMDMARYREIQRQLRSKMHDSSSLFVSVSKSKALPPGMASITILAIAPPKLGSPH